MKKLQSWNVSDDFWARVERLIPKRQRDSGKTYKRRSGGGRKPQDPRKVFEGILYVLRTGCQWKALPQSDFGSASAVHKYFLKWQAAGLFERLWQDSLLTYDELEGIAWEWQSQDGAMVKAPMALELVGKNPTDRGKKGSKKSLLVDERGIPLSLVLSGANTHDVKLLSATLDSIVIERPGEGLIRQNLCLDAGYVGETAQRARSRKGIISRMSGHAAKRLQKKPKTQISRLGAGLSKFATPGLTGSENSWCAMKKWSVVTLAYSGWLLPSSFCVK